MIVVVYRKTESSKKKYMKVFVNEITPDRIINLNARKPLIPNKYPIDEIGIGESFITRYKERFNIKNHEIIS
tara:strand:- start:7 stop:222 length:216 start_codon:yes stop_codon:yes gene_type:complete